MNLRKFLQFFCSNLVTANGSNSSISKRIHSPAKSLDTSIFTRCFKCFQCNRSSRIRCFNPQIRPTCNSPKLRISIPRNHQRLRLNPFIHLFELDYRPSRRRCHLNKRFRTFSLDSIGSVWWNLHCLLTLPLRDQIRISDRIYIVPRWNRTRQFHLLRPAIQNCQINQLEMESQSLLLLETGCRNLILFVKSCEMEIREGSSAKLSKHRRKLFRDILILKFPNRDTINVSHLFSSSHSCFDLRAGCCCPRYDRRLTNNNSCRPESTTPILVPEGLDSQFRG